MKKPILITGPNRSGTTWVGKIICNHPDLAYVDEPFNLRHRQGIFNVKFDNWYQFVCDKNSDKYFDSFNNTINFKYNLISEFKSIRSVKDLLRMFRDYTKTNYFRLTDKTPLIKVK